MCKQKNINTYAASAGPHLLDRLQRRHEAGHSGNGGLLQGQTLCTRLGHLHQLQGPL